VDIDTTGRSISCPGNVSAGLSVAMTVLITCRSTGTSTRDEVFALDLDAVCHGMNAAMNAGHGSRLTQPMVAGIAD
jgi:hypothetical protein